MVAAGNVFGRNFRRCKVRAGKLIEKNKSFNHKKRQSRGSRSSGSVNLARRRSSASVKLPPALGKMRKRSSNFISKAEMDESRIQKVAGLKYNPWKYKKER